MFLFLYIFSFFFFFFQAEDGIRDLTVTGVQTCALPISRLEPVGRLARRGPELALRADVAARRLWAALSLLPGRERRVARSRVPAAGPARGDRDAEVLSRSPQGASAAGQAQPPAEARLHFHRAARRALRVDRARHLQAGAVRLAHRAVRRLPGGALLALLDGVDLHSVHRGARGARVPRGPALADGDDHRLVSRTLSQS